MLNGDSRFFEESINANKVKALLDSRAGQASNTAIAVQDKLQGMKWLLAMFSKGRDMSQFYPSVVKNVITRNVELKKLVYVYLMHYADHDKSCEELALLSINSFQKDLADSNSLIRALALRTMTSIRAVDIVQLQLLAVQKCSSDSSLYVRKIAARALPKIYSLDQSTKADLIELLSKLFSDNIMVVGSAICAFNEICPNNLDIIHPVFRRLCAYLVDLDEWSQALAVVMLARYARSVFCRPKIEDYLLQPAQLGVSNVSNRFVGNETGRETGNKRSESFEKSQIMFDQSAVPFSSEPVRQLPTNIELQSFYAEDSGKGSSFDTDRRDDSSDSGALSNAPTTPIVFCEPLGTIAEESFSIAAEATSEISGYKKFTGSSRLLPSTGPSSNAAHKIEKDDPRLQQFSKSSNATMEADHKLLLKSCLPLLHSKNSSVVLAVISILWHCGRKSSAAMQASAEAFARLMHSHREVQYVALNAMIPLVLESPWYFRPYVCSFFVEAVYDSLFVRFLKIDVMALLVADDTIDLILTEFEVYVAHPDKKFVCYVIQAIGRVVNDRPAFLDRCVRGLMTLMTSSHETVAGEAVVVMRKLLQKSPLNPSVIRRLIRMLDQTAQQPFARASLVWVTAEFVDYVPEIAPDVLRKFALTFEEESLVVKMQVVNLAVRLYMFNSGSKCTSIFDKQQHNDISKVVKNLLTYILDLARFDPDHDLRDRVRFLCAILNENSEGKFLFSADQRERILLGAKPSPSSSKLDSKFAIDSSARFAIDSLAHCVGHAPFGYQPLADWPTKIAHPEVRDSRSSKLKPMLRSESDERFFETSSNNTGDSDSGSDSSGNASNRSGSSSNNSSRYSSGNTNSDSSQPDDAISSTLGAFSPTLQKNSMTASFVRDDELLGLFDHLNGKIDNNVPLTVCGSEIDFVKPKEMEIALTRETALQFRTLLSNVHGDGLHVDVAFLRTKTAIKTNTVILRLTNRRSQPLHPIKISGFKLSKGQEIFPFEPIDSLAPSETVQVKLAVDFFGKSNRPVRFSFSTDRGTFPVALEAPCGELVIPAPHVLPNDIFMRHKIRLRGLLEAVQLFGADSEIGNRVTTMSTAEKQFALERAANVVCAVSTELGIQKDEVRAAAVKLNDPEILVLMSMDNSALRVCCDDAIFAGLLLNEVYRSL